MKTPRVLIVLLYTVYSVHAQATLPVACNGGDSCIAGGDTTATCTAGACACTAGTYYGAACQTQQALSADLTGCTDPDCVADNTITCDVTTTPTCICNEDHVNVVEADCSEHRVQAVCENTKASFTIRPHAGFSGTIYFLDSSDLAPESATPPTPLPKTPECAFAGASGVYTLNNFYYEAGGIPAGGAQPHATCAHPTNSGDAANPVYEFRIYVQYKTGIFSNVDRIIKLQCSGLIDSANLQTIYGGSTTASLAVAESGLAVTENVETGVTLTLTQSSDGSALPDPVPIGLGITATLHLPVGASFNNMALSSFKVTDHDTSVDGTSGETAVLVADACVPADMIGIVTKTTKVTVADDIANDGLDITVEFNSFMLAAAATSPDSVVQFTSAEICIGDCATHPGACAAPDDLVGDDFANLYEVPSAARRKRDADISNGEVINLLLNFTVGYPSVSRQRTTEMTPNSEDCYTTLAFILPLVMMAVLLLLALIMVYVFFTKLSHARNSGMNGETNMAYKS